MTLPEPPRPLAAGASPLQQLAALACQALETPAALVRLLDGGGVPLQAAPGLSEEAAALVAAWCLRSPGLVGVPRVCPREELEALPGWALPAPALACASVLLAQPGGAPSGVLCVLDGRARAFTPAQLATLEHLARLAQTLVAPPPPAPGRAAAAGEPDLRTRRLQVLRSLALTSDREEPAEDQVKRGLGLLAATFPELRVTWAVFEADGLVVRFSEGPESMGSLEGLRKPFTAPGYLEALRLGRAIANRDVFEQPLLANVGAFLVHGGARATLDVLLDGTRTSGGMLSLHAPRPFDWQPEHVEVLTETARQAGLVLRRAEEERLRSGVEAALRRAGALRPHLGEALVELAALLGTPLAPAQAARAGAARDACGRALELLEELLEGR